MLSEVFSKATVADTPVDVKSVLIINFDLEPFFSLSPSVILKLLIP
jgi:hypothetical protein